MSEQLTIAVERPEQEDVRSLLLTVQSYPADIYPPESRHGLDLAAYERSEVTLFVAREAGVAVGCGAFQRHRDGTAEVKSMFVDPVARGRGIGRAILAAIEDALRGQVAILRLETGIHQGPAIRLYESAGFRRRGPFGSYRDDPLSVFMEKALQGTSPLRGHAAPARSPSQPPMNGSRGAAERGSGPVPSNREPL